MGIEVETLAAANKFTTDTVAGAGALKGAPCEIQSITRNQADNANVVTFKWENGSAETQTSAMTVPDGAPGADGSVVTVTQTLSSGTKIGSIGVDGTSTDLFAPNGGGSADLPWITPQDYGAVGDGVTDDSTAIQSAFNAGGVIYFPKGVYKVSNPTLNIKSNTTIIGEKGESIVLVDPNFSTQNKSLFRVGESNYNVTNINIIGITLRGSETFGTSEYGIGLLDIMYATNVSVIDCLFQNNMYSAIRLINSSNIRVFNSRFEACDMGVAALGSNPVNDVTVRGCHFTGLSSLNNFTNFSSEQVGTFIDSAQATPSCRWVVEDCIFEHKTTNAVSFNVRGASSSDTSIKSRDCVVRNCTFRAVVRAIMVLQSENVDISNIFVDSTEKVFNANIFGMIQVTRSKNVFARNLVSESAQLRGSIIYANKSTNILIADVNAKVNVRENSEYFATFTNLTNATISNVKAYANGTYTGCYVNTDSLTDTYIDICGNKAESVAVNHVINDITTNVRTKYVLHSDVNTNINRAGRGSTVVDPATYIIEGNGTKSMGDITNLNNNDMPKYWTINMTTQTQYENSLARKNITLISEGSEMILNFVASSYTNGKTFTFDKTGNIVPIDKPFIFSNDYKVVCHFVQKNAKWVEVERTLEYYAGANKDAIIDIPYAPSTDGTYSLQVTVLNGVATYSWV